MATLEVSQFAGMPRWVPHFSRALCARSGDFAIPQLLRFHAPHRCRFPNIQFLLPPQGSLSGVNSGLLLGLLNEITPALMPI